MQQNFGVKMATLKCCCQVANFQNSGLVCMVTVIFQMNPKFARRGTVYSLTERLMSASAAKKEV